MRVVIYPRLSSDQIGFRFNGIKKRSPIFAEQNQFFVKQVIVNPPHLPSCAEIRDIAGALYSFFTVYWPSLKIEDVN